MRSKLFVPAIRPELFPKALRTEADAICFDLEDAVPVSRKNEARENLRSCLSSLASDEMKKILVRVNPVKSEDFLLDMQAAVMPGVFAVALPKVETAEEVQIASKLLAELEQSRAIESPIGILVTVESPRGLRVAHELASASTRVAGLQLGFADLLEPLGISSGESAVRQQVRLTLRLAAAEAGVSCYEAAYPAFRHQSGFLAQLKDARALGFAGASCIHPSQIDAANSTFTPTAAELAYAESVLAAAAEAERNGDAVVKLNGKMIDRPFVLRARSILDQRPNLDQKPKSSR